MTYRLLIDDERTPAEVHAYIDPNPIYLAEWVVVRTVAEAVAAVEARGFPDIVSFDHDLGEGQPTGKDLANWLVARDLDLGDMPEGFRYLVHSRNPTGAENIRGLMDGYLENRAPRQSPGHSR